jgi:hypothetical protein
VRAASGHPATLLPTNAIEVPPPHGAYTKAKDHGPSIAGQGRASQQKRVARVRFGSVASHPDVRDAPGMSAMPPIATQSVRRNEASRCAITGCEQMQQRSPLFGHLVGAHEQCRRPATGDRRPFGRSVARIKQRPRCSLKLLCNGQGRTTGVITVTKPQPLPCMSVFCV